MQYALLIYRQETALGSDEGNTALSELLARHVAFTRDLGPTRIGGAGLKSTANATTVRTQGGARRSMTGRLQRPRSNSAASISSMLQISMPRSPSPGMCLWRVTERSRSGRCWWACTDSRRP